MSPFAPVCGCPEHDFGCAQLPTKATMPDLAILTDEQIETYLSPAQKKTLTTLKKEIWEHDSLTRYNLLSVPWNTGDHEVKRWEVKATEGDTAPDLVFLYSVIGRRNDEGTMAEVFARNKRMIVIGRRGGCQLLNPARYVTRKGKTVKVESKVQPRGIPACSSRATS